MVLIEKESVFVELIEGNMSHKPTIKAGCHAEAIL